jgi:hypothetical protein
MVGVDPRTSNVPVSWPRHSACSRHPHCSIVPGLLHAPNPVLSSCAPVGKAAARSCMALHDRRIPAESCPFPHHSRHTRQQDCTAAALLTLRILHEIQGGVRTIDAFSRSNIVVPSTPTIRIHRGAAVSVVGILVGGWFFCFFLSDHLLNIDFWPSRGNSRCTYCWLQIEETRLRESQPYNISLKHPTNMSFAQSLSLIAPSIDGSPLVSPSAMRWGRHPSTKLLRSHPPIPIEQPCMPPTWDQQSLAAIWILPIASPPKLGWWARVT